MNWKDRIVYEPEICHGYPCIKGTRVLVSAILDNLADGVSFEDIIKEYPSITIDDIKASLSYAADLSKERNIAI